MCLEAAPQESNPSAPTAEGQGRARGPSAHRTVTYLVSRASAIVVVSCALISCARAPAREHHPAPAPLKWCIAVGGTVDSALAVAQARHVFEGSVGELMPHSVQRIVLKDSLSGLRVDEGFLVWFVPVIRGSLGGGGLVWVNGATGCPILLIQYE